MENKSLLKQAHSCLKNGLMSDAYAIYTEILDTDPRNPIALHNIGQLAKAWGKIEEAHICFRACYQSNKGNADFMRGLLAVAIEISNNHAIEVIEEIYHNFNTPVLNRVMPNSEFLYFHTVDFLCEHIFEIVRQAALGNSKNALSLAFKALKTFGANPLFYYVAGFVLSKSSSHELAKLNFKKAKSSGLVSPNIEVQIAICDYMLGSVEQAISHFEACLNDMTNNELILHFLAQAYLSLGNNEKARENLIALSNGEKIYPWALSELLKLGDDASKRKIKAQMSKILSEFDENAYETVHVQLKFALAKHLSSEKNYPESFKYYNSANAIKKRVQPFSMSLYLKSLKRIEDFSDRFCNEYRGSQLVSDENIIPIFVVGMPRSGTSLTEQILSQHSRIYGAGELSELGRLVQTAVRKNKDVANSISDIRSGYFSHLINLSKKHSYFVDKTPTNFQFIPLILRIFPEAKIIHLKRDARAVCWSNYCQDFSSPNMQYSNELNQIVEYFNLYYDKMSKYEQEYGDRILHLNYEDLTNEPESHIRCLLRHVGVEFQRQCLAPEKNKTAMRTASRDQVRKPIYSGSSDAWRNYEEYIGEYFEKLKNW